MYAIADPYRIPRERYFDRAFHELEKEKLWPFVWQMACRLEEIPEPGDYVEYEICDQSILVVRQHDGSIKAFDNACRHRATQLALGAGRFGGGQIVCPYHGWRWNVDGSPSFLVDYETSAPPACVSDAELRLQEVRVEIWGACVWINMDPDARPFVETLGPAGTVLEGNGIDRMRVRYWKEVIFHANWKVAQEAFLEGLHTMQAHPQLAYAGRTEWKDTLTYTAYENGHGQFAGGQSELNRDAFLELMRLLYEGQDPMTRGEREYRFFQGLRHKVPADANFREAAVRAYYDYAEGAGIELPPMENAGLWGGEVFLFPNFFTLPLFANALGYRCRPYDDDPEWSRFEVWSLHLPPDGPESTERPVVHRYPQSDEEHWGLIPRQDFSNIERQQRGMHSRRFGASRLYPENDKLIWNMHQELDRYLAR